MDNSVLDVSDDAILEHFGVKGMRWGIRRRSRGSDDFERHRGNLRSGVKNLSDKDLQSLVNRLNMEQSIRRLNPSKAKQGHNFIKGLLAVAGTAGALATFSQTQGGKRIGELITAKARSATDYSKLRSIGRTSENLMRLID